MGVYTILGLGLSIVIGQAGLLDLGYIAFYAIGAYWTALLSTHFGVSFWILLPTSAVLAAVFGVVLGYPTLRLRGDYLAIVTLGFGEIIRITLNNWRQLTNGPMGIMNVPHPAIAVPGIGVLEFGLKVQAYYFFVLALAAMTAFVVRRLVHSRIGLAWKAIREDELAAGAMGVDVRRAKLLAFGLGAAFAGLAGSFFAGRAGFVSPESFTFAESMLVVVHRRHRRRGKPGGGDPGGARLHRAPRAPAGGRPLPHARLRRRHGHARPRAATGAPRPHLGGRGARRGPRARGRGRPGLPAPRLAGRDR